MVRIASMAESNSPPRMTSSQSSATARARPRRREPPHSSHPPRRAPPHSSSLSFAHPPLPPPSTLPPPFLQPLSIAQPPLIDLNQVHQHNEPHHPPSPPPPPPTTTTTTETLPLNPLIDLNQDAQQNQACTDELLLRNGGNFSRSEVPVRIMFFQNKLWNDFKGEVLESLRISFASGKTIVPLLIEGLKYAFDFLRMLQVHIQTKSHRSIAWVDKNGRPFFPGRFIDCDFSKVVETNDAGCSGKKKRDSDDDDGDVVITGVLEASKFPNTRILSETEKTYIYLDRLFMNNVGTIDPEATIISIHDLHISSPIARARWSAFEKQIVITEAARGRENVNVVYGWYAAPAEKVASIFNNGFNLIEKYPEIRPSIGAGIFLADLESPQHSGMQHQVEKDEEKYLILCRIVLGKMERVDLETHQTHVSNTDYDTGCDDPKKPNWYVIWGNDINKRVLPVCVITCKTNVVKDVQWEMTPVETTMIPRFYLEVKKRVPIEFIPPLQDIYDIYKKNGMDMELFKKQVRALLGDQKMAQIFKEIYDGEI